MPPRPIHVRQLDFDGCGVACVAMLAGVSYDEALAACFPRPWSGSSRRRLEVDGRQMLSALRRLGYSARMEDTFVGRRAPALLVFSYEPAHPTPEFTHCVVWDHVARRIMDPGDCTTYVTPREQRRELELWEQTGWSCIVLGDQLPGTKPRPRRRVPSRDCSRDPRRVDRVTFIRDFYDHVGYGAY